MFTGIIETVGFVKDLIPTGSNKSFWIESPLSSSFKVDQSVSHSGVCLTVEEIRGNMHRVTAIEETLSKTNLGDWKTGQLINLERCLLPESRIDGHFVQGHVDTTGLCLKKKEKKGSWEYEIQFPKRFAPLLIEKGVHQHGRNKPDCFQCQETILSRRRDSIYIRTHKYSQTGRRLYC